MHQDLPLCHIIIRRLQKNLERVYNLPSNALQYIHYQGHHWNMTKWSCLCYIDLIDIISLVNKDIPGEIRLQFVYRIIWVILKDRPDISILDCDVESVFIEISKDQLQVNKNILIEVIQRRPATMLGHSMTNWMCILTHSGRKVRFVSL